MHLYSFSCNKKDNDANASGIKRFIFYGEKMGSRGVNMAGG